MFASISPRLRAILQALFVTFLWSTSWVFIKIGLKDDQIPALTFAGLRYMLAFAMLVPLFLSRPDQWQPLRSLPRRVWIELTVLGLLMITLAQGAQFVALERLPAMTTNLLLSFTAILVTIISVAWLHERPTPVQYMGIALYLFGALAYFYPFELPLDEVAGLAAAGVGLTATAVASVLGRRINTQSGLSPLAVTIVTMGIGAVVLLVTGLILQGLPPLRPAAWLMIGWLALVNTAFAFTLWNQTLRILSAFESTLLNNAMMIQIPILAWLFLSEEITTKSALSFLIAALGILAVQIRRIPLRKL